MARPDTAWFYYYWPFYWHSKSQIVPGWTDTEPVDNPTTPRDPCDDCPSGYDCEDWKCVSPWQPTVNPNPLDNPTVDTECRTYASRGSWISTTASWVFSWYDANSWWQWTFKCEESITFYWRLNHWLLNDIRWWVWNHVRSFVVPVDSIDEQSIFRFTENVDWTYKIEIKRKASWDTYYDWQLYLQWKLEEADWETLYVWVSSWAQIWWVITTESTVVYEWAGWTIVHRPVAWTIELIPTSWDVIVLMDKDYGAPDVWEYWNWYAFRNCEAVPPFQPSYDNPYDVCSWEPWEWFLPDWWMVPSQADMANLIITWSNITGLDYSYNFNTFKSHLLLAQTTGDRYIWRTRTEYDATNWICLTITGLWSDYSKEYLLGIRPMKYTVYVNNP